jgi:mono/diheme cytochrome c family protein
VRLAMALIGATLLSACDSGTEEITSVASTRTVQRSYVPVPPGTVPRGTSARAASLTAPGPDITPDLIRRGRERFLAFCSPCHGSGGYGDGPVVSRGFPSPPSYHQERLQGFSPAQIVTVITQGKGMMYSYADRVPPEDRWAIAHYIKTLQQESAKPESERKSTLP